jgi:putative transposase
MARKWTNLNLPGALHYVTGNVRHRIPTFKEERCCLEFFRILREQLEKWPSRIINYVLMPEHFHLIVNPRDGNIKGFCGALKSLTAKRMVELTGDKRFLLDKPDKDGSIHQFWQDSFKAFPLWSGWMIWQKLNYIHNNPVKAKLVTSAKDYKWSSFRAFYFNSHEPLPVDFDWWWEDDAEKLKAAMTAVGWPRHYRKTED